MERRQNLQELREVGVVNTDAPPCEVSVFLDFGKGVLELSQ
uniref:Uncharacterized protein n=1 Tax=Parascaris equorum TaxID=6256 RepID=A0A914RE75_PAREQ